MLENAFHRLTLSATHQPRSWLNAEALRNIEPMFLTLCTAQSPMSWLKAMPYTPLNILYMLVTPEVSQAPMSTLKAEARKNM